MTTQTCFCTQCNGAPRAEPSPYVPPEQIFLRMDYDIGERIAALASHPGRTFGEVAVIWDIAAHRFGLRGDAAEALVRGLLAAAEECKTSPAFVGALIPTVERVAQAVSLRRQS